MHYILIPTLGKLISNVEKKEKLICGKCWMLVKWKTVNSKFRNYRNNAITGTG